MNLTENFTLEEMLRSTAAIDKGFKEQFNPPQGVISNLQTLCEKVLEPLRKKAGVPVRVTSAYRCERTNAAVGGVKNSQHLTGEAADTHVDNLTVEEWYRLVKNSDVEFDQCIQEFDRWVHISYKAGGKQRRQCIRAVKEDGLTQFIPD